MTFRWIAGELELEQKPEGDFCVAYADSTSGMARLSPRFDLPPAARAFRESHSADARFLSVHAKPHLHLLIEHNLVGLVTLNRARRLIGVWQSLANWSGSQKGACPCGAGR